MKIVHISRSKCAFAPERAAIAIERYSEHRADYRPLTTFNGPQHMSYELNRYDVVHWHNVYLPDVVSSRVRQVVTFHSPPENRDVIEYHKQLDKHVIKTVVCHYHACLNFYKQYTPIRNIVDMEHVLQTMKPYSYNPNRPIKFIMTPTKDHDGTIWQRKGLEQMLHVFEKYLYNKFTRKQIQLYVVTNDKLLNTIARKNSADVVIDECVTPSYHLSGLEGLALGKPTFCWVDPRVLDVLKRMSGSDTNPFLGDYVGWLPDIIEDFLLQGPEHMITIGNDSKKWMNKYWNPKNIVQEYLDLYNQ